MTINYNPYMPSQTTWWPSYSQPYQYPQPPMPQKPMLSPMNNIIKVAGPESAKAFSLSPNSAVILMDENQPIFYLKTTDDGGYATMRTFDFCERKDKQETVSSEPASDVYATKKDLQSLTDSIADLKKLMEGLVL